MGAQQRRGEPGRSATPGRNSQGSHMSSIVLPPSQWPTDTRRDGGGSGATSAKSRPASGGSQNRPGSAGTSRGRAQSAERVRPR